MNGWREGVRRVLTAVALAVLLGGAEAQAGGEIFTYVDSEGIVHFTNRPGDARFQTVTLSTLEYDEPAGRPPDTWEYDGVIGLNARLNEVQPGLVKAVIAAESNFDAHAVSRKGAQGLMQLMPETSAELGVVDPFHPEDNVRGGVRYLRSMIDRYEDLSRALAAYNAGPTAVDRYGGIPPYRETRDYVRRVLTYYRYYHDDFAR